MKKSIRKMPGKNAEQPATTNMDGRGKSAPAASKIVDNDAKQDGNSTQPLEKDAVRKAAAAEQTKLQHDPDSLPSVGFPTKRDPVAATKNGEDPVLPKAPGTRRHS